MTMVHTMSVSRAGDTISNGEPVVENEDESYHYVPPTIPVQTEFGLRLSALNPKYLHTNSTSHTWPFSAIAELVDNAYDPDVKASQMHIDLKTIERGGEAELTMTFADNGNGMTPEKLYKMLSFGFCEKVAIKGHKPVGHYGNGFKSGSMRIGKDALVFTKNAENRSLGFLSQTYLAAVNADTIIVPMVTWDNLTGKISSPEEETCSLPAILKYSVIESLEKIKEEFACIQSEAGTRIIISKLRRTKDKLEFDIMSEKYDIRIPEDIADSAESNYKREERQHHIPASDFSLRAYLSILYLKPKMQIYLRTKKVKTVVIRKSLSKTEVDVYKPQYEKPMKIVFGFSENVNHYGIMMYHCNRLIKPYVRVGCQLKANNQGVGVVGVIECGSLQPTHNKQDFDYTPLFRATMNALGNKLNEYWNEKTKYGSTPISQTAQKTTLPDELWVQCDSLTCLKWRKLPGWVKKMDLPDKWYCHMHPDQQWSDCSIPEEEEEGNSAITPYEKKLKKRTQQLKEMERLKMARKKAAELQLDNLKRQRAEVRNQLQQQEIARLRNQLSGSGPNQVTSSAVNIPPIMMPGNRNMNMLPTGISPQVAGVRPHPGIPPGVSPLSGIPPQHPGIPSQISGPHSGIPNHVPMVNGQGPVVSQVFSMNNLSTSSMQNQVKHENSTHGGERLHPRAGGEMVGSKKRPISLDSDDEEDSPANKSIKTEDPNKPQCIELLDSPPNSPETSMQDPKTEPPESPKDSKTDRFIFGMERLLNGSPFQEESEPVDEKNIDGPDVTTLTTLLGKRSQALRNLRTKIYDLSKILFPDVDLPDIQGASIDDSSIEDFLDTVIAAHTNTSSGMYNLSNEEDS